MIRTIRLSVDKPVIPEDSDLEHSATSWEVSLIPNFEDDDALIVKNDKDEDNLLDYEFNYDLGEDQPLYIRTKLHFKKGDDEYEGNWSKIIPLNVKETGIKMSSVMIVTPTVTVKPVYEDIITGELQIKSSEYLLYAGTGTHKATSYVIETIEGKKVFERLNDEDNLTELKIDLTVLDKNVLYVVKVKYHSTTNAESNWGKAILKLTSEVNNLYDIKRVSDLKPYRTMYFKQNVISPEIRSTDIELRDYNNNVVAYAYVQTDNIIKMPVGNIKPNVFYKIYTRVRYSNGLHSNYKLLEEVYCVENYLVNLNSTVAYRNTNNLVREFNTNSLTVNYTYELTNGNILFMKHNDSNIYLYKVNNTTDIEYSRSIIDLGDEFKTKAYFLARELPSGRILVDVVDNMLTPYFIIFEYNPVTDDFTEIVRVKRDDEVFSTAVSGSLIAFEDDQVVYVPARIRDGKYTYLNLEVRYLDIENGTISKYTDLPNEYKGFVNLFRVEDKAYMIPGSGDYTLAEDKERLYERLSNNIYEFDYKNKEFIDLGDVEDMVPTKTYCLHPVVRKDGKVALFNNVFSGDELGNQDVYLLDTEELKVTKYEIDTIDILSYRNTLVSTIGNIFRITSRVRDSQKLYIYAIDDGTDEDSKDDDTINKIVNLVVPKYKTITIESPYRFETISVDGDSYDDTGTLRLIIDGVVKEVRYRDLLIYRDTHWDLNLYEGDHPDYDNIYILDDAIFEINYFIDIPDNESLTLTQPIAVEYIIIGEDATLTIDDGE